METKNNPAQLHYWWQWKSQWRARQSPYYTHFPWVEWHVYRCTFCHLMPLRTEAWSTILKAFNTLIWPPHPLPSCLLTQFILPPNMAILMIVLITSESPLMGWQRGNLPYLSIHNLRQEASKHGPSHVWLPAANEWQVSSRFWYEDYVIPLPAIQMSNRYQYRVK